MKATERPWFERFLMSVMGPPSVGDVHAPSTYEVDPADELCPKCGKPFALHERVHGRITYLVCPD